MTDFITLASLTSPGPLRGGEVGVWGYFPGAQTNRGPRALVNTNVDACTPSYYNPFCAIKIHKIAPFQVFFLGENPQTPFVIKLRLSRNITWHNMYTRGPKLKLPQG